MRFLLLISVLVSTSASAQIETNTPYGKWFVVREVDAMTDAATCSVRIRSDEDDATLGVAHQSWGTFAIVRTEVPSKSLDGENVAVDSRFDDGSVETSHWLATGNIVANPNSEAYIAKMKEADRVAVRFDLISRKLTAVFTDMGRGRSDAFAAFDKCVAEAAK